jgi:hypothetical protein
VRKLALSSLTRNALALLLCATGSLAVAQPASRAFVLDTGAKALVALELPSGKRLGALALPGLRGLFFPPDRSVAVALARQALLLFDGTTGKPLARLTDFQSPDAIAFAAEP